MARCYGGGSTRCVRMVVVAFVHAACDATAGKWLWMWRDGECVSVCVLLFVEFLALL